MKQFENIDWAKAHTWQIGGLTGDALAEAWKYIAEERRDLACKAVQALLQGEKLDLPLEVSFERVVAIHLDAQVKMVLSAMNTLLRQEFPETNEMDFGRMQTATEEAVHNAVTHGNNGEPERVVLVQLHIDPPNVNILVENETVRSFDPRDVADCTTTPNLEKPTGRGILLIRTFMHRALYVPPGNRLVMHRDLQRPLDRVIPLDELTVEGKSSDTIDQTLPES